MANTYKTMPTCTVDGVEWLSVLGFGVYRYLPIQNGGGGGGGVVLCGRCCSI